MTLGEKVDRLIVAQASLRLHIDLERVAPKRADEIARLHVEQLARHGDAIRADHVRQRLVGRGARDTHHALNLGFLADGVGGLKLSLSLVDFERTPQPEMRDTVRALTDDEQARIMADLAEDPLDRDSPLGVLRDAVGFRWQHNLDLARRNGRREQQTPVRSVPRPADPRRRLEQ